MATTGTVNSTNVIVKKGGTAIVGQMEMTATFNGTPIDVGNKSAADFVELMDGELAGKQLQLAGSIVYNDDTVFRQVRADALTGTQDTYSFEYVSSATTDESFSAAFVPNGLSDSLPHGDKVMTSITFLSSGVVTHVDAVT
jgi:hypothetical protein